MPSIKITKAQEKQLDCICGLCEHTYLAEKCLYNKICDAENPALEQKKQILKWVNEVWKIQKCG